jgi:hypothetical protein
MVHAQWAACLPRPTFPHNVPSANVYRAHDCVAMRLTAEGLGTEG